MEGKDQSETCIDEERAWRLLLLLARSAKSSESAPRLYAWQHGRWSLSESAMPGVVVAGPKGVVSDDLELADSARRLFELYLPLVVGEGCRSLVLGHLGQSLDGRVATPTGVSQFITSREDIVHTHRLRALFDVVIVGVNTVRCDNPQLTTRLVPGQHPTRVILDPSCRLGAGFRVFEDDAAPTLVFTAKADPPQATGRVQWITTPVDQGLLSLPFLFDALRRRGLARVFVEGGGVTVSRFLAAGALRRLHICVAPMILGSGAPSVALPPIDRLDEAMRFRCRHFSLGTDMLFDCELGSTPP